jgi:hypothetical protein
MRLMEIKVAMYDILLWTSGRNLGTVKQSSDVSNIGVLNRKVHLHCMLTYLNAL